MSEYLCQAFDGTTQVWFYVSALSLAAALTAAQNHVTNMGGLGVVDGVIPPVTVRILATTLLSGTVTVLNQPIH